ncbi:MAG: type IV pilus secretin PilQ [Thermodesulfovibrionales bacterium]|nr:type IV pilus secretin PilQ [Thermodesulfovibrionales bacterium]
MTNVHRTNNIKIRRCKHFLRFKVLIQLLFLFAFFNTVFFEANNILAKEVKIGEITDIEISDYTIKIKTDAPFNYRLYKVSDPFTVVLDMEEMTLGQFTQKIFPKSLGISEIKPSQLTSPTLIARFEILLIEPADVVHQIKDGALILNIKADQVLQQQFAFTPPRSASKLVAIRFVKTSDSLEMSLKGDGNMPDPLTEETESSITIFLPKIKMAASIPKQTPPPIREFQYSEEDEGLRIKINFDRKIDPLAFAFAEEVIIDIPFKEKTVRKEDDIKKETVIPAEKDSQPSILMTQQPSLEPSKFISLDFQDADVVAILRLLAEVGEKNIIIHPEVRGKISMKLMNVPWEQALEVILKSHNLIQIADGNVIRVVPIKILQEETKLLAELKEVQKRAENLHIKVFTVNYANVEKIKDSIEKSKILTKDVGSISVDPRTRTVTVKDIPSVLEEIEKIIKSIDKPTKQVLIEARIVEINSKYSRGLGIEWGLKARPFNWESAIVGSVSPPIAGGLGSPGLINLPAATGTALEPTSAITFGYLNRKQTLGLDLRLSAIENVGKGRIISKPKIITGDNQKAKIVQGESIPYGERTTSGGIAEITTKFKDVAITIEVTPQITDDNNILLDVLVNKEDLIEFVNIGGGTLAPRTSKLESRTNLLLENGETMVIGGVYKRDERDNEERVPFVASIPFFGELFKKTVKENDTKEFMIFLTPKIVLK